MALPVRAQPGLISRRQQFTRHPIRSARSTIHARRRRVKGPAVNDGQVQIFNPTVPTMHLHNSCDIAGICPNGELLAKQLEMASVSVRDTIINFTEGY